MDFLDPNIFSFWVFDKIIVIYACDTHFAASGTVTYVTYDEYKLGRA